MEIVVAQEKDRESWDAFVAESPEGSFLQSWWWGSFQGAAGFHVERVMFRDKGVLLGACLLVEHHVLMRKSYWYAPWGPVTTGKLTENEYLDLLQSLRLHLLKTKHAAQTFLRVEPKISEKEDRLLTQDRFSLLHRGVQPRDTLLLDLRCSEDDLLRQMHSKTRYNIRLAIRHGVTIAEETNETGVRHFLEMAKEIEQKDSFHFHPAAYYRTMVNVLGSQNKLSLLVAYHDNDPLAAGIFIKFGGVYTYAHGASFKKKNHVMAPHMLHWEALLRAKKEGFFWYDFFGIAPDNSVHHPWAGISRFKRGFGGQEKHYIGAADAIFDPFQYRFFNMARAIREIIKK